MMRHHMMGKNMPGGVHFGISLSNHPRLPLSLFPGLLLSIKLNVLLLSERNAYVSQVKADRIGRWGYTEVKRNRRASVITLYWNARLAKCFGSVVASISGGGVNDSKYDDPRFVFNLT